MLYFCFGKYRVSCVLTTYQAGHESLLFLWPLKIIKNIVKYNHNLL